MGIGLLILVNVGKQNMYISSKPEITFFKITYKRYSNYSIEQTPQYFKTQPDFGRRCTVNIGKNADLLYDMLLYIELPSIQLENNDKKKEFKWVNKIGIAIINFIEIEINNTIIDRHYSDWLNIWYELTINSKIKTSYDKMIGNIKNLNEFSISKEKYKLYIPLTFWFCIDATISLPLVSLYNCDIKIHVDFNDIDNCYSITPSYYIHVEDNFTLFQNGDLMYQKYNNIDLIGQFISYDYISQIVYFNPVKGILHIPTEEDKNDYKIYDKTGNKSMTIKPDSEVVKERDYFIFNKPSILNSYLLISYIFLDNDERKRFYKNKLKYIIPVVQTVPEKIINTLNTTYDLPLYNPVKLLVWRTLLQYNKKIDKFNYTSYPYEDNDLINKNLITLNSVNITELDSIEYYTTIPKYQYEFYNNSKGIYTYSFSLNPKSFELMGSLDFNKINNSFLNLSFNKLINYQNSVFIQAYAINYKLIFIENGIINF